MGGSNEIEETKSEKTSARIAADMWDLYQNEMRPYEDAFMSRVDSYLSDENMASAAEGANLAYSSAFSEARGQAADQMAAAGIDPSSGRFQTTMSNMTADQVDAQTTGANDAQINEQNKWIAGQMDIASMGMGQQGTALQGLSDSANNSLRNAVSDAQNSFNQSASLRQALGITAGGVARYGQDNNWWSNNPGTYLDAVNHNPFDRNA